MQAIRPCLLALAIILATTCLISAKPKLKSSAAAEQKPEDLLAAAEKVSSDRPWRVEAHVNGDKDMKLSGIVFGNDFDLTTENVDGATRQITLGDKSWSSGDGGKTWNSADPQDRRSYYLIHTPIKFSPGEKIPPFEKVKPEKGQDASVVHLRFIAAEKIHYEGDRPNWWISQADPQSPIIQRYNGPAYYERSEVTTDASYTPISDSPPVVAPPGNPHAQAAPPGPEALLMEAMKKMKSGVWSVNATVTAKEAIKVWGLLEGNDFDLSMDPGVKPNTPLRGIVLGGQAWICSDGETWHAGTPNDRVIYNWVHTPIMSGRMEPPFEETGREQRNGQTWLQIKLKVPEKNADPNELPQYSLVLDAKGQPQYIGHAAMPMFSQARGEVIHILADYASAKEKITPPPLPAPVDNSVHGFYDIEQHKSEWAGKVVRVEVTPKILQSEQIAETTYRAFLKDSAGHYGRVEFPYDALVKLGFLKKVVGGIHTWDDLEKMGVLGRTEGDPVSFYVEVISLGPGPAARAIAVGAKVSPAPDGKIGYSW